eukprot:11732358-Alexandrium_andersonii.AAC.1
MCIRDSVRPGGALRSAVPPGLSSEKARPQSFGRFQALEWTVRPFGAAQTAASSNWALAPDPILAMG